MTTESKQKFVDREHRFTARDLDGMSVFFSRDDQDEQRHRAEILDFSRRGLKLRVPVCLKFEEKVHLRVVMESFEIWYDGEGVFGTFAKTKTMVGSSAVRSLQVFEMR